MANADRTVPASRGAPKRTPLMQPQSIADP